MSVIVGDMVILHVPKTGGMWIREVLEANNIDHHVYVGKPDQGGFEKALVRIGTAERHHYAAWPESMKPRRVIMVRRYPVTWYESFWLYRKFPPVPRYGWNGERLFDGLISQAGREDFTAFIMDVIKAFPGGFLRKLYSAYQMHATDVWELENLEFHLSNIFGPIEFPEPANRRTVEWSMPREIAHLIHRYEGEPALLDALIELPGVKQ